MKKKILSVLSALLLLAALFALASCNLDLSEIEEQIGGLIGGHEHHYSEEWTADENAHWHACECGEQSDYAEHVFPQKEPILADCVNDTPYTDVCEICGYESKGVIRAAGHRFGEWETVKPATDDEEGEQVRTCTVCGESETKVIPVLGTLIPIDPENYYAYRYLVSLGEAGEPMLYVYAKLVAAAEAMPEEIDLTDGSYSLTTEQLDVAYTCYRCDYPQHFWVDDGYGYSTLEEVVQSVSPNYSVEKEDLPAMIAAVESRTAQLLAGISAKSSDAEIEMEIHDRLVLANAYDTSYSAAQTHSLYGSLVNGRSVCDGYAEGFQYLLNCAGIEAFTVSGMAYHGEDGEHHAWNIVLLDGEYYCVDVTWDDPVLAEPDPDHIDYTYLNVTTAAISLDHDADEELPYPLPVCTATAAQYYIYHGYTASELSIAAIREVFAKERADGVSGSYPVFFADGGMTGEQVAEFLGDRTTNLAFYDMVRVTLGILDPAVSYGVDDTGHVLNFVIQAK